MVQIIPGLSEDELSLAGADFLIESVLKTRKVKRDVVVALPGGSSVSGIYTELAERDYKWADVHFFMVDERMATLSSDDSNYKHVESLLFGELFERGLLPAGNVHPFMLDEDVPDLGVSEYNKELIRLGGLIDVVLLSAGSDGHVASLFPEHDSILDDGKGFIRVSDSPKPPSERVSASRKLLLQVKAAVLVFTGDGKEVAYNMFMDGHVDYFQCPAKVVSHVKDAYVLTDIV